MGCHRCGGRMLSRSGVSGLVCSNCGAPVPSGRQPQKPHPLASALVMLGAAAFSGMLFFLTNWHPRPPERSSERGMIKKITTGAFEQEAVLIEKGSHNDE